MASGCRPCSLLEKITKTKFYSSHKLCYTTHTDSHFDIEGGWSAHGSEESSSKKARKEGSQEEVVVAQ